MKMLRYSLVAACVLCGAFSVYGQQLAERIENIGPRLDRTFYETVFDKRNIDAAYQLAQEEDFDPGEPLLISKQMNELMRTSSRRGSKMKRVKPVLEEMYSVEEELQMFKGEIQLELLQQWRQTFLAGFVNYVRYRNSLKKRYRLNIISQTMYDSNLHKVSPEDLSRGTATGKADWQQTLVFNLGWMPFINNKSDFNKKYKFEQVTNLVAVHAGKFKNNEVLIMDTESKLSRDLSWGGKSLAFGYRINHFSLGARDSRNISAIFFAHRFRFIWTSNDHWKERGRLVKASTSADISWMQKNHFTNSKKGGNADGLKLTLNENFTYKAFGSKKNRFRISLEAVDYRTSSIASQEYRYSKIKLDNVHYRKFSCWKHDFKFGEGFSLRSKDWDKDTNQKEQQLWGLKVFFETKLTDTMKGGLRFRYNTQDQSEFNTATETAKQYQVDLGLKWSL